MKRVGQIVGHLEDLKPRSSDVALQNALSPALDFPPCGNSYCILSLDDLILDSWCIWVLILFSERLFQAG